MWKVRVEELLLSDRALLLGHPMHSLSNRIWAKSEVRLARDCKGYTLLEYEAHYGENYEVHWNLGEPCSGGRHELARHEALLRLLKEHNIYIRGWRVLAHPSSAGILPRPIRLRILHFPRAHQPVLRAYSTLGIGSRADEQDTQAEQDMRDASMGLRLKAKLVRQLGNSPQFCVGSSFWPISNMDKGQGC